MEILEVSTIASKKKFVSLFATIEMDVSIHSGNIDYEWAIAINRACLKLLGAWPDNNETEQRKFNVRIISILIVMICSCLIPSIHALIRIWGDFMLMVDNLQYTLPFLVVILKTCILWRKSKELAPILRMVKEDWLKFKMKRERDIMIKRARIARIITICGYFMVVCTFIFAMLLPTFGVITPAYATNTSDPDHWLLMPTYYIYDTNRSPSYEITLILQSIGVISAGAIFTSTDNLLGLLIFHVCGQLENLKTRILHLDQNDFYNTLSYNVQDHRRLIRSIKIIEDTFTLMLLGILFCFALLFTVHGFLIVTVITQGYDLSFSRFLFIASASVAAFAHMCLYCIVGEILVTQCNEIFEAACEYKWYKLEPRKAKTLLILMIRANKPLYITAGKLFPMTMSTLCNLIKTSGGYISFLLAYRE
ncbi:Odorant receptor 130 [Nylanderia fulva]|uniref:Odorant receptor n=2 Tax=Nylanderia fulva TaxID=613905 RepID=A0A6G1LP65_9HYME|nr:Odorant receptor 130 [Nylanderia fulva]